MKCNGFQLWRKLSSVISILILGANMSACASGNSASWKEEVFLHDGKKINVEHSQNYGGYPTIDSRDRSVLDETWEFTIPGTQQNVIWKNDFGNTPESNSVMLLILDFLKGTPYLATSPAGCIAYNKWGRPNPPYVFFKYDGKAWQRIPLEEFPAEFTNANVYVGRLQPRDREIETVSIARIDESNRELAIHQPHLRTIARKPIKSAGEGCGEMVYDGKGGWIGTGWFRKQPSYEACLKYCGRENISSQYCPCDTLFKGK